MKRKLLYLFGLILLATGLFAGCMVSLDSPEGTVPGTGQEKDAGKEDIDHTKEIDDTEKTDDIEKSDDIESINDTEEGKDLENSDEAGNIGDTEEMEKAGNTVIPLRSHHLGMHLDMVGANHQPFIIRLINQNFQ